MEDIKNWLETSGSYVDGLELAKAHLRNRNIIRHFEHNQDYDRLRYELQKLVPVVVQAVTIEPLDKPSSVLRFDYEALPEELKPYYDRAANAYQVARKWHYAMKDAKSDERRKECRGELLAAIGERSACWMVLDNWKATGELPRVEKKSLQALASLFSREMAKLVKKPTDETLKTQIVELAIKMREQGRVFAPKTLAKLAKHNIILPDAETLDDR